jgi:ankyrin repeat protein
LHRAAASGDRELIKRLLRTDAEETKDNAGRIPLVVALVHGHTEAAKLLGRVWEVPGELLSALAESKMTDLEKHLFVAASTDNVNSARFLIRLGVNIEARGHGSFSGWGGTALIEAIWFRKTEVAKFLLSSGADKMARDAYSSKTAADWAKEYGMGDIMA